MPLQKFSYVISVLSAFPLPAVFNALNILSTSISVSSPVDTFRSSQLIIPSPSKSVHSKMFFNTSRVLSSNFISIVLIFNYCHFINSHNPFIYNKNNEIK